MAFGRSRREPEGAGVRLVRSWHFSAGVLQAVEAMSVKERCELDLLVRRLDADPISNSLPLAGRSPPGQRVARFGSHVLLLVFDPVHEPRGKVWCRDIDRGDL